MSDLNTRDTMGGLGRFMQSVGDSPDRIITGTIAGTSYLTQDGSIRHRTRLYIDLDGTPPIKDGRVYVITIEEKEKN